MSGTGAYMIQLGMNPLPEPAPLPEPFIVVAGSVEDRPDPVEAPAMERSMLAIPSLGVSAAMIPGTIVGEGTDRTLQIPPDPARLTVFREGASPCDSNGTVLVAGHVSSSGVHGALWPLAGIRPLAAVYMSCEDGTRTQWEVVAVFVTPKGELSQDIFTSEGRLRAEIVTCGGPVMPDGHYRDNVRVELRRVQTTSGRDVRK
jgi:hypothetical protein